MKELAAPQYLTSPAYTSIKNYILREDLGEWTRLTEDGLSRQLGISKSPFREALNSLRTEGLVRIEARRGAYVRGSSAMSTQISQERRVHNCLSDEGGPLGVNALAGFCVLPEGRAGWRFSQGLGDGLCCGGPGALCM